jgi:putative glutamine amidotransferase
MKKILPGIFLCLLFPVLLSFSPGNDKHVTIALSKASPNYISWIHKCDSTLTIIDLSGLKPELALKKLKGCAGLILTGGGDVDPSLYGNAEAKEICTDIDASRDVLEKMLIGEAIVLKMPIMGICRGEQMLNVTMGGSLISDIPHYIVSKQEKDKDARMGGRTGMEDPVVMNIGPGRPPKKDSSMVTHQCDDYLHCGHTVWLEHSSLLRSIIGIDTGFVTTNHHQAILMTAKELKVNAHSGDGLIEGIEWNNATGKSFMVGVQWHPERMELSNPFSGKLLTRYIAEVKKYALTVQTSK